MEQSLGVSNVGMLPQRVVLSQDMQLDLRSGSMQDTLSHEWLSWIRSISPSTLMLGVPNCPAIAINLVTEFRPELIILTGGTDVGKLAARDQTERALLDFAFESGTAVLGVCRGMQFINHVFGGSLTRLPKTEDPHSSHVGVTHAIRLRSELPIARSMGRLHWVNSFHNFGIIDGNLGKSLVPLALSDDGVVEALYGKTRRVLGVQWHPERANSSMQLDYSLIQMLLSEDWKSEAQWMD